MVTRKTPTYECIDCCFKNSNKKDFNKHTLTAKHMKSVLGDTIGNTKKPHVQCIYCNKFYKSRNGCKCEKVLIEKD
jgi:hypothetical protein